MKMRILVIEGNVRLAEALSSVGCPTFFIDYRTDQGGRYGINEEKVHYIPVLSTRKDSFVKRLKELRTIIKDHEITHVITSLKADIYLVFLIKLFNNGRLRIINTNHNSYAWINQVKVFMYVQLIRLTTDAYFSLADFVKRQVIKYGYKQELILSIANVVPPIPVKQSFEINKNKPQLLYVSRYISGKGHLTLAKAIKIVRNKYPGIIVHVYGNTREEAYKREFVAYVQSNGLQNNFVIGGELGNDKVLSMLSLMDIYISTSVLEMNPIGLIEAGRAQMPIIAVNSSGIVDVVKDHVSGLLFEPNDARGCASCIEQMIEDDELRSTVAINAYNNTRLINSEEYQGRIMKEFMQKL
jgi:glycosyltransferase involved in cell wall biosynthesis